MIREKEYTGQGYYLAYLEVDGEIVITGCGGRGFKAEVPKQIDGLNVVKIERKAFLSRKTLKEIHLPETIREIGDWAFAYCSNLETVTFPGGKLELGRALFLDCGKLKMIKSRAWSDEAASLLSAAVTGLDAYYMLDGEEIGSSKWIRMWDARVLDVIDADDLEGYQKQILCGEEDYGSTDVSAFLKRKRMFKVGLAMLRLLNPVGLDKKVKAHLEAYLKNHTKGCASDESWLALLENFPDDLARIQLFLDLECANENNMDMLLKDMGEEHPEMKAIFLRYQDTHIGYQDFFADLEL